jgi:hypothetical protein
MKALLFLLALALCNFGVSQKPEDTMVLIPVGEFTMGKNTSTPSDWQPENLEEDIKYLYNCKHNSNT